MIIQCYGSIPCLITVATLMSYWCIISYQWCPKREGRVVYVNTTLKSLVTIDVVFIWLWLLMHWSSIFFCAGNISWVTSSGDMTEGKLSPPPQTFDFSIKLSLFVIYTSNNTWKKIGMQILLCMSTHLPASPLPPIAVAATNIWLW